MDVAGVLQKAGDADSRPLTRFQVKVEYSIIPYTFMSIRLPHLCEGYHDHCSTTANDGKVGGGEGGGGGSFMLRFGWWDRGGYIFLYS